MSEFSGKPQYAPPTEVPDWFVGLVESIMVADHLGDVWSAMLDAYTAGMYHLPDVIRAWVDRVYEAHEEGDYFADDVDDDVDVEDAVYVGWDSEQYTCAALVL
jgi:hypothetical protein